MRHEGQHTWRNFYMSSYFCILPWGLCAGKLEIKLDHLIWGDLGRTEGKTSSGCV